MGDGVVIFALEEVLDFGGEGLLLGLSVRDGGVFFDIDLIFDAELRDGYAS